MKQEDYFRALFKETKISTIMSAPVTTIHIDEPFFNVYKKFTDYNIKHLIVVDSDNRVKGLITLRDLYSVQAPKRAEDGSLFYNFDDLQRFILSHVMTKNPITFHAENDVASAVIMMGSRGFGCIPIVDDKGIITGVITQSDMIKIIAKILEMGK